MSVFKLLIPHEVIDRWPELSARLAHAIEMGNGECALDDILKLVLSGRMFVFADNDFVLTAEFTTYPQKTVMVVGFGSGEVKNRHFIGDVLQDFARKCGASSIQTFCRNPAMIRYYRRWFQLDPIYTVLEKQL